MQVKLGVDKANCFSRLFRQMYFYYYYYYYYYYY